MPLRTMKTQANPKTATVKKTSAGTKKTSSQTLKVKTSPSASQQVEKQISSDWPPVDLIAARAYKIWQQQGCPEGREEQHWWQAEQEIMRDGSHAVTP